MQPVGVAHVAELVDAVDSKSAVRKGVKVRFLSWALSKKPPLIWRFFNLLPLTILANTLTRSGFLCNGYLPIDSIYLIIALLTSDLESLRSVNTRYTFTISGLSFVRKPRFASPPVIKKSVMATLYTLLAST